MAGWGHTMQQFKISLYVHVDTVVWNFVPLYSWKLKFYFVPEHVVSGWTGCNLLYSEPIVEMVDML